MEKQLLKKWVCRTNLNFHVLHVDGGSMFSPAKLFQGQDLMTSTYVRSLLFVKMEKAKLGLNLYVHILCSSCTRNE